MLVAYKLSVVSDSLILVPATDPISKIEKHPVTNSLLPSSLFSNTVYPANLDIYPRPSCTRHRSYIATAALFVSYFYSQ